MTGLDPVKRFVFASSRRRFIAVLLLASFCKTGVWAIPNLQLSQTIALDPFTNPIADPFAHYLYWNWFSPFVAWLIGATGLRAFFVLHLAFAVAFTSLVAFALFDRLPEREARVAFVVFCALPVSGTIYYWVGMDAVVLFLMLVPLVFPRSWVVPLLAGIALGMQHFEQGVMAGGVLFVTVVVARRMRLDAPYRPGFAAAWVCGTIVGKSTLIVAFAYWGVEVNNGRLVLFAHEFRTLLLEAAFHGQVIVWSMLGVGWLVLAGYVDRLRRQALPLVVGLLLCMPFLVLAQDETRVMSVITFPLLAGYWLFDQRVLARVSDGDASFILVAWLVVPWSWTWLGIPRWSALPYDVYWLLQKVFGRFPSIPDDAIRLFP
jgi:hypothetical protein